MTKNSNPQSKRKKLFLSRLLRDRWLYIMLCIPIIIIFIFLYIPMYYILNAFKDFNMFQGFLGSPWVGFKHFISIVNDPYFHTVFYNTVKIGTISMLIGFPAPIILALFLNEVKNEKFKKTIQTLTYLPNFISMVAICGIIIALLEPSTGIINSLLKAVTGESVYFLTESKWFVPIYVITEVWQRCGYSAIIYLAALSGIDPTIYESAMIDGASRFKRMLHITLPGIKPVILMLLILGMPGIINVNFEKILLLYRPIIYEVSDVIPTYVYRRGLLMADFSYGTAVGFSLSILSLGVVMLTNKISKKLSDIGLW